MFSRADEGYMGRALELAALGLASTQPNPRVGCVIVKDGEIVGEGWHRRVGEAHAEIIALEAAGESARGATLYLTLEPCCHQGRTPPCVERVQAAGLARVVVAMCDPNPQVDGNSLERLRAAGIRVEAELMAAEAEALNRGFVSRMRRGRPWVVSKIAASLDGRTALASGESKWITGPRSREDVQRLRAESAAVMTGVATVIADDPSLNVRLTEASRQPLRVILDSRLTTPLTAKTLGLPGEVVILTCHPDRVDAFRERGIRVEAVPEHHGRVDLQAALTRLAQLEVNEVLVEAGPTLNGGLVRAGLVDELVIYLAPVLLGDAARGMFELPGLERMSDKVECEITEIERLGDDLRIRALCGRR